MHAYNLDIINARLFLLIFREEILPKKMSLDLNLHDFHPDTPPPFLCHMRKDLIKIEFFQVLGYVLQKN